MDDVCQDKEIWEEGNPTCNKFEIDILDKELFVKISSITQKGELVEVNVELFFPKET